MDDCAVDGSHVRCLKGGPCRTVVAGRPWAPRLPASRAVDRRGATPAVWLTGGNRQDVTQLIPLLDAVPRVRGLRGRPRNKPKRLYADRGYEYDTYRRLLRKRGIKPLVAAAASPTVRA
jgi:hypothetical protein